MIGLIVSAAGAFHLTKLLFNLIERIERSQL